MAKLRIVVQLLVWLMPASARKNSLLRRFGHQISESAKIDPTIVVGVDEFRVGDGCKLGLLNVFRGLRVVEMEAESLVESWNWVSAHPIYRTFDSRSGTLYFGYRAKLGSRCYVDCSGTVIIRKYGAVGGNRCLLQTHEPDYATSTQTIGRITVDEYAMTASSTVLLKNAYLPSRSLLAANSTLRQGLGPESASGLYAGSPAVWKRALATDAGSWFRRTDYEISKFRIDSHQGVSDEDRRGH
ncbi:acyltransferase [Gordonia sp. NPDC003376]